MKKVWVTKNVWKSGGTICKMKAYKIRIVISADSIMLIMLMLMLMLIKVVLDKFPNAPKFNIRVDI